MGAWIGRLGLPYIYTLPWIKWVTSKSLLYTRSSTQLCSDLNGKETQRRGDIRICMDGWLLYSRDRHRSVNQLYSTNNLKNKKELKPNLARGHTLLILTTRRVSFRY